GRLGERIFERELARLRQLDREIQAGAAVVREDEGLAANLEGALAPGEIFLRFRKGEAECPQPREYRARRAVRPVHGSVGLRARPLGFTRYRHGEERSDEAIQSR